MRLLYGIAVLVIAAGVTACTTDDDPPATSASSCPGALGAAFDAWGRAGFSGTVAVSTDGRFVCLAG
ncbi:hypothetical protein GCM10009558_109200 [Virgisporangium aurantiacum]